MSMLVHQGGRVAFNRSVWLASSSRCDSGSASTFGHETVANFADCGECLALLEEVWPTTQADGLDERSPWAGEVLLSRYELAIEIGRGSFGVVYCAIDLALKREVAIKLPLQREGAHSAPELLALQENEALALAKLAHPNILRIYDVGKTKFHQFFIVSQQLNGGSLAGRIVEGPLSATEAASMFAALADALSYAHRSGVIHRDIKPSNILFDDRHEPHLADFGLATGSVSAKAGAGTPLYMAPEQLCGASVESNELSDMYSLGVSLYESLAGSCPFVAKNSNELERSIAGGDYRRLENVPIALRQIQERAMAVEPSERFQSAAELTTELRRVSELLVNGESLTSVRSESKTRTVLSKWFLAAALVALGGLWCSWYLVSHPPGGNLSDDPIRILFDSENTESSVLRRFAAEKYIAEQRDVLAGSSKSPLSHSKCLGMVNLYRAQLQDIRFGYETDFRNLCLVEANMSGIGMPNCWFRNSVFTSANLSRAAMIGSDFSSTHFDRANLSNADFRYANLIGSKFERADLSGASLKYSCIADISNWKGAVLDNAKLDMAVVEAGDWIERVGPSLRNPAALDGWKVEKIPAGAKLPDVRFEEYKYWLRPVSAQP